MNSLHLCSSLMQMHIGIPHSLRGHKNATAVQDGQGQGMDQDRAVCWREKTLISVRTHT